VPRTKWGDGQVEIEYLKEKKVAGKLLPIHAELEALRLCLANEFLQLLPSRVDPEGLGRLRSAIKSPWRSAKADGL
jgi:hypothetical protein